MSAKAPNRSTARVFGFPVTVKPGFLMFMVLIVFINGNDLGLWMAGGIAVFTLAHELGHAFAARATGAEAEISLDFLAGYASYSPPRPLARWERAGIALAGPATQIVLSCAVLIGMGVNPLLRADFASSNAALAIWWSGPMLGALNLLPLMPLDGGNVTAAVLDFFAPGRGETWMTRASLPITLGLLVFMALDDRLRPLTVFLVFLLVFQLQSLTGSSPKTRSRAQEEAQRAEDESWRQGRLDLFAHGTKPSPWVLAHMALQAGRTSDARQILVDDLTRPNGQSSDWFAPRAADPRHLAALVQLLPRPLPTGNAYGESVLTNVLVSLGEYETAGRYGAEAFTRSPTSGTAILVSRSAAALGDHELAVRWLQAAMTANAPVHVVSAIDSAPELHPLRYRPDVQTIRADAAAAASA